MDNTNGLQEVRVEIKSPITINRNKSPDLTYSVAYCRPFAVSIGLIELVNTYINDNRLTVSYITRHDFFIFGYLNR